MAKKKESKTSVEKCEIEGHSIQIRKEGNVEQLLIDSIPQRFFMRNDSYVLFDNAYATPQKTLIEAVKIHLQGASKKSGSKKGR